MNIKKNLWESTVSSRGADADVFSKEQGSLYPGTSKDVFNKNLNLLNQRIYSIHKQLTYWNLYKITTSVNSSLELEGVVSSLAPGEACIINTSSFTNQNRLYSRGDVIVKLISNELVHIPSVNSGLYYPAKVEARNGSYSLSYKFATVSPSEGSSWTGDTSSEANAPAETMIFNNLVSSDASFIYGNCEEIIDGNGNYLGPLSFNSTSINTITVYPVIKFFYSVETGYEEISLDYNVELSSGSWQVSLTNYTGIAGPIMMQVK